MRFRAQLKFLASGGRTRPVFSGYRPQMRFAGHDWECRRVSFLSCESVAPGEEADALIELSEFASSALEQRLRDGFLFELAEGARVVATGRITDTAP